jgi:hypothetical protein
MLPNDGQGLAIRLIGRLQPHRFSEVLEGIGIIHICPGDHPPPVGLIGEQERGVPLPHLSWCLGLPYPQHRQE